MEDSHICQAIEAVPCCDDGDVTMNYLKHHYLFAVLDGHGGDMAADYSSQHFCKLLCQQPAFQRYATMVGTKGVNNSDETTSTKKSKRKQIKANGKHQKKWWKRKKPSEKDLDQQLIPLLQRALEDALVELDCQLLQEMISKELYTPPPQPQTKSDLQDENGDDWAMDLADTTTEEDQTDNQRFSESVSGSTVAAVLVTPNVLVCANLGDSRAVFMSSRNHKSVILPLSRDHKPDIFEERERIEMANGSVQFGRVDGELAVSRALGDFEYKSYPAIVDGDIDEKRTVAQQLKVSSFPEVMVQYRNVDEDRVLVVACDGIWDVLSNQECLDLVSMLFQEGESDLGLIAEEVLDTCLKKGSRDNMTIIVAKFPAQSIGSGGGVAKRRSQRVQHKV
jgi:serine/threonine protein phosphatase PrpC